MEKFHWQVASDYSIRQGKYLRPILLLIIAEGLGYPIEKTINVASAMQLSEDWILIHDDFEDNSDYRRGKPTLHKLYSPELAVNAGDAIHILSWKFMFDSHRQLGWNTTSRLLDEFFLILSRTALGQAVEIKWAQENSPEISDQDWFFIANSKVSYYTIAGPIRLGAIAANATDKQLEILTNFGLHLGYCFQIVDDLLDLTSDFGGLKKQTGNDIYEGKRTIMLGHLLREVNSNDRQILAKILSKPRSNKKPEEVSWVIAKMKSYGSLDYARQLASREKDKAMKIFKQIDFLSKNANQKLSILSEFILNRDH